MRFRESAYKRVVERILAELIWPVGLLLVREMVRGVEVLRQVGLEALNWQEHAAENRQRFEMLALGVHDEIDKNV